MAPMAESQLACIEKLGLAVRTLRADAAEFTPAPFTPVCQTYSNGSNASTGPPSPMGSAASTSSEGALAASACLRSAAAPAPGLLSALLLPQAAPPSAGDASFRGPLAWLPAPPGSPAGPPPGLDVPVDLPPGLGALSKEETLGRPFEPWFVSLPKGTRKRQLPKGEPVKKQPPTW